MLRIILIFAVFVFVPGVKAQDASDAEFGSAEVDVRVTEMPSSGWQVELTVSTAGLGVLELRDMRHTHDRCPSVSYEVQAFRNAELVDGAAGGQGYFLRPGGPEPIEIAYTVTLAQDALSFSTTDLAGCSAIVGSNASVLIDGRALLLGLRPLDVDGAPYRFGRTSLNWDGQTDQSRIVSTGTRVSESIWSIERFDDLRFAFMAVGDWRVAFYPNRANPVVAFVQPSSSTPSADNIASPVAAVFEGLAERWGEPYPHPYTVFLSPVSDAPESFAQFTGVAKPGSAALIRGRGLHDRLLTLGVAHEVAHIWIPSRLGRVAEDVWIGEGLAELIAHTELNRTGYLPNDAVISRINRAIRNVNARDVPPQLVYDQGMLAWIIASRGIEADLDADRFASLLIGLERNRDQVLSARRFWEVAGFAANQPDIDDTDSLFSQLPCRMSVGDEVFDLVTFDWPEYETGWVFSEISPGSIVEIVDGGPAQNGGLAVGDVVDLIESYGYGDTHNLLTVHFQRGGMSGSASFHPASDIRTVRLPQYVREFDANGEDGAVRCGD